MEIQKMPQVSVSPRRRLLHGCVLWVAIVAAVFPYVFWMLGGTDFLTERFGTANVWFRSWEGNVAVPDPHAEYELTIKSKKPWPEVLMIKVSAGPDEVAEIKAPDGQSLAITLPAGRNQVRVIDAYGGNCTIRFVPKSVTGREIRIKWLFGY